jgi:hypothetical protein
LADNDPWQNEQMALCDRPACEFSTEREVPDPERASFRNYPTLKGANMKPRTLRSIGIQMMQRK